MENVYRNHQFDKVFDENCTILILGSFPSLKSIEKNFYYGHKQNRFYRRRACRWRHQNAVLLLCVQ